MTTVGTMEMAEVLASHKMFCALHKFYDSDQLRNFIVKHIDDDVLNYVFFTFGITDVDLVKLEKIRLGHDYYIKNILIDSANGYSVNFLRKIEQIRKNVKYKVLMAGNVCTADITQELCLLGVDIVKVGIGPGLGCTTRKVTGVGYPQLSAVLECANAAHGLGKLICADGGCRTSGDVMKAFGAGADFVMLGGMFAGTWESIEDKKSLNYFYTHKDSGVGSAYDVVEPQKVKFYGMSSEYAMNKHYGSMADYRAAEGVLMEVDYKGPVAKVVQELKGGVASGASYIGASNMKDIPKCSTFVRISK